MLFQPPFPETESEVLEALFTAFHFVILIFLILLMIYCFRVLRDILPIIVVYAFSMFIGLESLGHAHQPLSPMFEIFFMLFQSSLFIMSAIEMFETHNNKDKG